MTSDEGDIREYLLGGLSAEERELIDLRIIEDDDYGVEALATEDRLIESYIDGELTEEDAERFRTNYLDSEERASRVKELAALRAAAASYAIETASPPEEARGGFFSFLSGLRPITAFAGAAVLLIAIAGAWYLFSTGGPTPLELEYAKLNETDMSDLSKFASYSSVELTKGTYRSGDVGSKVVRSKLTESVLFRLPLMFDPAPDARFDVALIRDGKTVFRVPAIPAVADRSGSEIRVQIPSKVITSGQYQISLTQPGTELAPVNYTFTAE